MSSVQGRAGLVRSSPCRAGAVPNRVAREVALPSPHTTEPAGPHEAVQAGEGSESIRQPWVELIPRGTKKVEYRSRPTNIRERVYIYASLQPANRPVAWRQVGKPPGELPTGAIVGTVVVVDCRWDGRQGCYAYVLRNPKRFRTPLVLRNQPQPGFWRPQF